MSTAPHDPARVLTTADALDRLDSANICEPEGDEVLQLAATYLRAYAKLLDAIAAEPHNPCFDRLRGLDA